jgi:carbon-monoxide dehydrogenase medium subunit
MWTEFEYVKPSTLGTAFDLLSKHGDQAAIFAGGTDLLVNMREGRKRPKQIVDIKAIPELSQFKRENGHLIIGSTVKWAVLAESDIVKKDLQIFAEATDVFGSPQIRNVATIGGNICRASPACDMGPPLLVLDATVTLVSQKGERSVPVKEFFVSPEETSLQKGEILKSIQVPIPPKNMGTAFLKIRRTGFDLAIVNAAAALTVKDKKFEDVRIALGSVAPTPIRAPKAEDQLKGQACTDENIQKAALTASAETDPISDLRSSAEYRREISKVLVKRAIHAAVAKAGGK